MDRWVEIDIDWFGLPPWDGALDRFVERITPLMEGERDLRGVILNIGWLADLVVEWTGRPDQTLPLRPKRYQGWSKLTYADLKRFFEELRKRAELAGLADIKLGILVAGVGEVVWPPETGAMYDLYSSWHDRHPELYPLNVSRLPGPDLDPRVPLTEDDYPYASSPDGLREGTSYPELLGDQWGSVSRFLDLDVIHLRDGFPGPLLYSRNGPYGVTASPDPEENATWTEAVIRLYRAVKEGNPEALVMGYSSGVSPTAEWRTGCVDFEALIADGALDIWIDQTWGGAWQDWWDDTWKGWTFQLANLLGHGAMVRSANREREKPCRHYKLIETWDGWEPFDTLHDTPEKLRWAMWAFSHAAVITPEGLEVPEGAYISWMNDWSGRLLSQEDIQFITSNLNAAEESAGQLEEVYGPLMVHDRNSILAIHAEDPSANASEWIEDQAGFLMKFGTMCLGATRTEWLPPTWPDGLLLQLPDRIGADILARLDGIGGPSMAIGRADRINRDLLQKAGVRRSNNLRPAGFSLGYPASSDLRPEDRLHLPEHEPVSAEPGTDVLYRSPDGALLAATDQYIYWQPPDFTDPSEPGLTHSQLGSMSPYIEAARALQMRAEKSAGVSTRGIQSHSPVTVHCWKSAGRIQVLVGNLESGWIGDARFPRQFELVLPLERIGLEPGSYQLIEEMGQTTFAAQLDKGCLRFQVEVPPEGCLVLELVERVA